jgi:hypothetical protein
MIMVMVIALRRCIPEKRLRSRLHWGEEQRLADTILSDTEPADHATIIYVRETGLQRIRKAEAEDGPIHLPQEREDRFLLALMVRLGSGLVRMGLGQEHRP